MRYLDTFKYTLEKKTLDHAIQNHELDSRLNAHHTAGVLNFYLQGLTKLSRLGYPIAKLRQQTDYFLTALSPWSPDEFDHVKMNSYPD